MKTLKSVTTAITALASRKTLMRGARLALAPLPAALRTSPVVGAAGDEIDTVELQIKVRLEANQISQRGTSSRYFNPVI